MGATRRRPVVAGLALAGVYLVAAVATLVLSDRPFRPLFDGLAPPVPYRWVNPPKETARDNQQPSAASGEVPVGPDGSAFADITPDDGQAVLLLEDTAIPPRPPDTAAVVTITPFDVLTLGPLPEKMTPLGNAYRVDVAYRPSNVPVTAFTLKTSSMALTAAGPSDALLYSTDGQSWDPRPTTPLGVGSGLETPFAGPGYYVVTAIHDAGGRGAPPLVIAGVLLVPPLGVGALVLRRRRAQAAAAARARAKAAVKKRAGPRSGGRKSKRRRR